MSFLFPHFEYDVFVSYSHGVRANQRDAPLRDWTHELIERLEADVRAVDIEFDELLVWLDAKIDPTIHITDEIREKVKNSGILMIVMSPRYLASAWCHDELEWFRQQVQDRSRDQGRVFVVRAVSTDEKAWPDFLRDNRGYALPGFQFHDKLDSMPYGWRGSDTNHEAYVQELWRLRTALTRRLRELRESAARRAKHSEQIVRRDRAHDARRIYLHARPEYSSAFDEIKRMLSQDGLAPLTIAAGMGQDMMDWARESRARIEAVKRCHALALVREDDDDRFIGDLLDIAVDERERIQAARGVPLPCAVLDRSGQSLPIDVSSRGIERFDLTNQNWRGNFVSWFDRSNSSTAVGS
jgi:hypothetical protein